MRLLSVNISRPKEVRPDDKIITTGIFKESVPGRVMLRALNLDGDGQADLNAHGGVHKAAYAYSIENYEYWKRELGRDDFRYGQFGENFTVDGMLEDVVHLGDVFRVGGAMVQISEPRAPCAKLALKMGLPSSPSGSWPASGSASICGSSEKVTWARATSSSRSRWNPSG